jgi:CelD/BcsL family acetyltransferase involved in cellulose biosynthesis
MTSVRTEAAPALVAGSIRTLSEFEGLAGEWDNLVRALPRPTPYLLHGWLGEWWRHYGNDDDLRVHAAMRDGGLVAALPLLRSRAGLRVTTFMGGADSPLRDVLLATGEPLAVAGALVERAAQGHDYADFPGLPAGSRLERALGERLRLIQRNEAPVLELTSDWEGLYRSKTSSKRRNLHRRRRRQLSELGTLETTVARSLQELEPALEEAFRLHALRWEGRPDGSGFATPAGQRFHRAVVRALAQLDAVRIVSLRLDGRAVAFHFFFVLEGTMFVHRLAFDPALGRYSAGVLNTLDAIEAAAAEGLTRVEFLGGAERYKLELADRLEPLYHGFGLERTMLGRAAVGARVGRIALRRRLKRSELARRVYFEGLAPARRLRARLAGEATDDVAAAPEP